MSIWTLEKADFVFIFSAAVLAAVNAAVESSALTVSCSMASINTHCSSPERFNQTSKSLETRKRRRRLYFNLRHKRQTIQSIVCTHNLLIYIIYISNLQWNIRTTNSFYKQNWYTKYFLLPRHLLITNIYEQMTQVLKINKT